VKPLKANSIFKFFILNSSTPGRFFSDDVIKKKFEKKGLLRKNHIEIGALDGTVNTQESKSDLAFN